MEHISNRPVSTSQTNGFKAQNKRIYNNLGYGINGIKYRHDSLHGEKYIREQNTRNYDIRYTPPNLQGLVRK